MRRRGHIRLEDGNICGATELERFRKHPPAGWEAHLDVCFILNDVVGRDNETIAADRESGSSAFRRDSPTDYGICFLQLRACKLRIVRIKSHELNFSAGVVAEDVRRLRLVRAHDLKLFAKTSAVPCTFSHQPHMGTVGGDRNDSPSTGYIAVS